VPFQGNVKAERGVVGSLFDLTELLRKTQKEGSRKRGGNRIEDMQGDVGATPDKRRIRGYDCGRENRQGDARSKKIKGGSKGKHKAGGAGDED